jgi:predicted nucleic acid-binding Zn ribbon protein
MDLNTTRYIVKDELKQFFSQRCKLNKTNAVKDTRILIYALLFILILLAIIFNWWLNWLPQQYWWGKVLMTLAFLLLLFWLIDNFKATT